MPLLRSNTADKFIVDRRKPHRNSDVARAVRRTRDRLSHRPGALAFDRELLKLHAHAMAGSATVIPLLVLVITAAGLFAGMRGDIMIWALLTVTCYAGLALISQRVSKVDVTRLNTASTKRHFLIGHFVTGLGWAYFATIACYECRIDQFPVIKAVVLLLAMAATALIASSLRGALLTTFALPVAIYAWFGFSAGTPADLIMAALLALSLPFFVYVSSRLNRSSVMLLSFRSEKDGLIAELETAKSMSDEARRRAEEANLAKSRFLASMSHELRTPLNAILGFSEVMSNEVLGPMQNPTYRDYARDVHDSGQHLLDLINDVLDMSKIEAERFQLSRETFDAREAVSASLRLMRLQADGAGVQLRGVLPAIPLEVDADRRAIKQIVLNLVSNALKFTPKGGSVTVTAHGYDGELEVIVADSGVGISKDDLERLGRPYEQAGDNSRRQMGTGLGLSLVRSFAELHGGEMTIESVLGEGTTVSVRLPVLLASGRGSPPPIGDNVIAFNPVR